MNKEKLWSLDKGEKLEVPNCLSAFGADKGPRETFIQSIGPSSRLARYIKHQFRNAGKTPPATEEYNEFMTKAEEVSFLENYVHPMIQLDPLSTILVMCHTDNTADKSKLREEHEKTNHPHKMKETAYHLEDIVTEPYLREFYHTLPTLLESL